MHTLAGLWKSIGVTHCIKKKKEEEEEEEEEEETPTILLLRLGISKEKKLRGNPLPKTVKLGTTSLR